MLQTTNPPCHDRETQRQAYCPVTDTAKREERS